MRLLSRYLAREVLFGTGLVFAALIFLFSFFDLIHELNDLGKGSYQIWQMFVFVFLAIPGHAYELFPIATLIGTLYGLSNLALHSEITVMRASGLSRHRLALALMRIGIGYVLAAFLLGEVLMPASEQAAQQWRLKALNNFVATQFRSGIWVKDRGSFINVRELLPDNSLLGLRIYQFDENRRLNSLITAQRATYWHDHQWRLSQVERTSFQGSGTVTVDHQASLIWDSVITPQVMATLLVEPEQMSVWNLLSYIRHLRDNSQQTSRFEIAEWSKMLYPFSIWVMMWLALPFALQRPRSGAVGMRIMIGIALGLSFYLTSRFFSYLGQLNAWNPVFSSLAPSLCFLAVALVLGWWMERHA